MLSISLTLFHVQVFFLNLNHQGIYLWVKSAACSYKLET